MKYLTQDDTYRYLIRTPVEVMLDHLETMCLGTTRERIIDEWVARWNEDEYYPSIDLTPTWTKFISDNNWTWLELMNEIYRLYGPRRDI